MNGHRLTNSAVEAVLWMVHQQRCTIHRQLNRQLCYADVLSPEVDMKKYSNSDFSFVLPEEWPYRDESDASMQMSVFQCPNAQTSLTVSLRRFVPDLPRDIVSTAFAEIVRIRRNAEIKVCESPGDVILTPGDIVDEGDFLYCKYAGIHGPEDRRLAALLTAENGKMLCFYVESTGTSDEYFNKLANSIFDSIEVT